MEQVQQNGNNHDDAESDVCGESIHDQESYNALGIRTSEDEIIESERAGEDDMEVEYI